MSAVRYVNVILPVPLHGTYTYRLPQELSDFVTEGMRVVVPFGRRKFYTGIVASFAHQAPDLSNIKDVLFVPDQSPLLRHPQLKFWEWMAEYYLCTVGEVYKAAVPAGLKIESETLFEVNPDFDMADIDRMTDKELVIFHFLSDKGKTPARDIERHSGFSNTPALLQNMFRKGVLVISESLVDRYRPKREQLVRVLLDRDDPAALQLAFAKVKGAPKQEKLLMTLLQMSNFTAKALPLRDVRLADLLDQSGVTSSILKALADKGIAQRFTREISRFKYDGQPVAALPALSEAQANALDEIHKSFISKNITLLFGVTASGKTEIYIHLVNYVLSQGNNVLYLVPEIALTTQLTHRLQRVFGDKLVIYHSKFTDNERVEIWNRLLHSSEPCVVLGARSAIFLPFAKLGLVIVDEEHEQSYKQFDPAPRYNARDSAIMLAHMHGAKTLLGSATPAIETYYKATTGKYALVKLTERYKGVALPEIRIVDMATEYKKKEVNGSFASATVAAVRHTVANGHQAIIFHNRRGFAPMARCRQCQYIPKCKNCDVSLTYHRGINQLVCHYCGTKYPMPETCPACGEPAVEVVGYGTERVEDEVEKLFPDARTLRMDLDTTRNKNSYEKLIETFSEHKADILVGTQMVTKGLDFKDVAAVAVVNADAIINFPDFRSAERAFNMLEQVSGRAGRRELKGTVLIQTRTPEHPVISYVRNHDYVRFYNHEIEERRIYAYPPFSRVINIYLKHRDERELDNIADIYGQQLRHLFGTRVNGPTRPHVGRVQNLYIRQLMLKVELNASMSKVKDILRQLYVSMHASIPSMRHLILYYDVDPY